MVTQVTVVINLRSKQICSFLSYLLIFFSLKYISNLQIEGLAMHGTDVSHFKPLDFAILEHKHLSSSLLVLQEVFSY